MAIFKKCSFPVVEIGCPEGWDLYQDTCYRLFGTDKTQGSADFECLGPKGGDLVEISSEGENNFVKELLRRNAADDVTSAWMFHSSKGDWNEYMEGKLTYTDWATPESPWSPDLECAVFSKDADWAWEKADCYNETSFVCERAATQTECFGGSCYDLHKRHSSIDGANFLCKEHGGYVVEIDTQEEQNFVKDFLNRAKLPAHMSHRVTDNYVWLGASDEDSEGNFYGKNSGTEVGFGGFSGWAFGQPNSGFGAQCTALDGNRDWKKTDVWCTGRSAVLCERPEGSPISG